MLREYESGVAVTDICRKNSVYPKTFYGRKNKYSGMSTTEFKRLKELAAEQAMAGDKVGASMTLVSSAVTSVPVVGTAASFAIDAVQTRMQATDRL